MSSSSGLHSMYAFVCIPAAKGVSWLLAMMSIIYELAIFGSLGGMLWAMSKVEGLARAPRLPGFMIAICGLFCCPGVLLMVPVGTMSSFWPVVGPFRAVGELVGCVQGRELEECAACLPPSEVYPAEKFQWHFTCGFDCRWFCSPEGVKRMRDSNCSVIIENESFIKLVAATGIAN